MQGVPWPHACTPHHLISFPAAVQRCTIHAALHSALQLPLPEPSFILMIFLLKILNDYFDQVFTTSKEGPKRGCRKISTLMNFFFQILWGLGRWGPSRASEVLRSAREVRARPPTKLPAMLPPSATPTAGACNKHARRVMI